MTHGAPDPVDPVERALRPVRAALPPASMYQEIRQRIRATPQRARPSLARRVLPAMTAAALVIVASGALWAGGLLGPGQTAVPPAPPSPSASPVSLSPSASPTALSPTRPGGPPSQPVPGERWSRDGQQVPFSVLHLDRLCNSEIADVLLLTMASRLGEPTVSSDDALQYVRDPQNRWAISSPGPDERRTLGRFAASVPKPADATFTGYSYPDGMELWRSEAAGDAYVFLRRGDTWEQWPRAIELFACV